MDLVQVSILVLVCSILLCFTAVLGIIFDMKNNGVRIILWWSLTMAMLGAFISLLNVILLVLNMRA